MSDHGVPHVTCPACKRTWWNSFLHPHCPHCQHDAVMEAINAGEKTYMYRGVERSVQDYMRREDR